MELSTVFQKTKALADLCRFFLFENEKKIKIDKGRPARKDRQVLIPVPYPDLEIRRGAGRSSRPLDKGEPRCPKNVFGPSALSLV